MSHLQENQKLPTDVKHGQYDPRKLPLESLKGMEIDIIVGDCCVEFNGECQYIIEDVENWAKENGGYWEWTNSGSIMFVK